MWEYGRRHRLRGALLAVGLVLLIAGLGCNLSGLLLEQLVEPEPEMVIVFDDEPEPEPVVEPEPIVEPEPEVEPSTWERIKKFFSE